MTMTTMTVGRVRTIMEMHGPFQARGVDRVFCRSCGSGYLWPCGTYSLAAALVADKAEMLIQLMKLLELLTSPSTCSTLKPLIRVTELCKQLEDDLKVKD